MLFRSEFFGTMAEGAKKHQAANAGAYELLVNGIKNETDLAEQVKLVVLVIALAVFGACCGNSRVDMFA